MSEEVQTAIVLRDAYQVQTKRLRELEVEVKTAKRSTKSWRRVAATAILTVFTMLAGVAVRGGSYRAGWL